MTKFNGVVVAGTFDRLHDGHKKLLNAAISVAAPKARIVVGITTEALLANKVLSELIQSYEERSNAVEAFLRASGPELNIELVPISEVAPKGGATDPSLECIVVSSETISGSEALNQKRLVNGLRALQVVVIDLVEEKGAKEGKILSSTMLRRRTLGTFIQKSGQHRLKRGPLSGPPFMVGLTGGIASGKSSVCELLRNLGAHTIDCDALAHKSYELHTPTYRSLVETFGTAILKPDASINRPALGNIVFNDSQAMAKLTSFVWPAVRNLVLEEKDALSEKGVYLCVAEAALMLEAGSDKEMDEVWMVLTPRKVALQRLMKRNNLTEEEADKRIHAQMTSKDRVARADVVIYNGWTLTETEEQVKCAWSLLQERMCSFVARWKQDSHKHPLWPRWVALMDRLGVSDSLTAHWWIALEERYTASWRCYHNFDEVQRLFKLYHKQAHFIKKPQAVQLAIFFHSACYEPTGVERQAHKLSIHFFEGFTKATELNDGLKEQVIDCIHSIEKVGDQARCLTGDAAWFHDFKLGIFCEPWDACIRSSERWRQELDRLNILSSAEMQASYFQRLLKESPLFATQPWKAEHEITATEQIRKLLQQLH